MGPTRIGGTSRAQYMRAADDDDTMNLLIFKLAATPLLVIAATGLQRRYGGSIGGLFTGLPVTSAPLSLFLALEHGTAFAARAAVGTLLGLIAMAGFCAAYARSARRAPWGASLALAATASGGLFVALSRLPQRPLLAAALVFPALLALALLIGRARPGAAPPHPWWDLPARVGFSLAAVLGITAAAAHLGPTWSGMLATLPVLSAIMGGFTHRHAGPEAARALLRGIVVGSLGAAAFNLIVAFTVVPGGIAAAYCAAVTAALVLAWGSHALLERALPALAPAV